MKRIAVYYRVSTNKQDTDSQRNAFKVWYESLAEKPAYVEFCDPSSSGNDSSRPQFNRMLNFARGGNIDTIVSFSLDRFTRKATEALQLILELDEVGVSFYSLTQPVLNLGPDVPFRRMILAMMAEIAQIERETIVRRVKAGMENAKANGKVLGQPTRLTRSMHHSMLLMKSDGKSVRAIAEHFGTGHSLVQRALKLPIDNNTHYAV